MHGALGLSRIYESASCNVCMRASSWEPRMRIHVCDHADVATQTEGKRDTF